MPKIVDHQASSEIEEKFADLVEACRQMGMTQELLVAMATTMQQELTHDANRDKLPHANGVELLMRGIEHLLRGDPEQHGYACMKMNAGMRHFNQQLTEV